MFEPAPAALRGFHLTALHNAYGLMSAAAETGRPHACWAHHMSVGGAKVADQLVALGYFTRRLDAKPGEVDTYRYRITPEGCAYISQPYLVVEDSMSDATPAPDVAQTPPDLFYPAKTTAPELKIVEPATPDGAWLQQQAADALHALDRDETALLARIHAAGGSLLVDYSPTRVSITKRGLIVLQHRADLASSPIVALTPLGEAAAALNAEMRIPADDENDSEEDDADEYVRRHDEEEAEDLQRAQIDEDDEPEAETRQRFTFKRGDRVRFFEGDFNKTGVAGTVDSQADYPFVLFKADGATKLIKVPEHYLIIGDEPVQFVEPDDSPLATQEIPAADLTAENELRADRDALIEQSLQMEAQIRMLRDQLAAVKSALADEDGALPDDPAATIAALKLHATDQQETIDTQHKAILNMRAQLDVATQETDILKRDVTSLKIEIAAITGSGEIGVQHDWTYKTTPADITARTLAGWTPWHKELNAEGLFVVWERKPAQKPARRDRSAASRATSYTAPTPRPAPAPAGGVLQPDAIVIPADMPADPAYRQPTMRAIVIDDSREPLNPMSAVMASFTNNLRQQFDANPLPQYADRPNS